MAEELVLDPRLKEIVVNTFTEESAKLFREQVILRSMADASMPIVVNIDSYGGYLDSLNMMLETIHQVPNPIITVCIGKAMSCGAVLLAAGDYRFCGKFSRVMIHQATDGDYGPVEYLQKNVDESKRVNDAMIEFLAKRCNKTITQIKNIIKDNESRDLYLNAEQCLQFGIIDFIGTPQIKPITVYQVEPTPNKVYPNDKKNEEPKVKIKTKKNKKTKK